MPSFHYTREDASKKAATLYREYLSGLVSAEAAFPAALTAKGLFFHSLVIPAMDHEINELAARSLEASGADGSSLEGDTAVYLHYAARRFAESGMDLPVRFTVTETPREDTGPLARLLYAGEGPHPDEEYLPLTDGSIDTSGLLENAFVIRTVFGKRPTEGVKALLNNILARYESTGRIYDTCPPAGAKASGGYSEISNYSLFLGLLSLEYSDSGSLRVLNATLKLNDAMQTLIEHHGCPLSLPLAIYGLVAEQKAVKELYDIRGYWLPAD